MRHSSFCRARFLAVHLAGVDVSLLPRALCKRGRGPSCSYGGPPFTPQLRPQLWSPKVVQKAVDKIRVPIVGTLFWVYGFLDHFWYPQVGPAKPTQLGHKMLATLLRDFLLLLRATPDDGNAMLQNLFGDGGRGST